MTTAETGRNTEFERPLSPVEKVIWRLNEGASLNVTMICRIRGALAEDVLREALDRLQQRHPYLRVRVEDSAQGLVYRVNDVPTIPLRVRDVPADGWLPIVEEEINRAIPSETGPLVRCIHLRHREELSHLLVTFHHVIGDAMSGAYMVRDILAAAKGQPLQPRFRWTCACLPTRVAYVVYCAESNSNFVPAGRTFAFENPTVCDWMPSSHRMGELYVCIPTSWIPR